MVRAHALVVSSMGLSHEPVAVTCVMTTISFVRAGQSKPYRNPVLTPNVPSPVYLCSRQW